MISISPSSDTSTRTDRSPTAIRARKSFQNPDFLPFSVPPTEAEAQDPISLQPDHNLCRNNFVHCVLAFAAVLCERIDSAAIASHGRYRAD
jgi:hypothetical protein